MVTIGDLTFGRYKELGRLVNKMINSEVILAAFKGTWLIRLWLVISFPTK